MHTRRGLAAEHHHVHFAFLVAAVTPQWLNYSWDQSVHRTLLQGCGRAFGMHPDQGAQRHVCLEPGCFRAFATSQVSVAQQSAKPDGSRGTLSASMLCMVSTGHMSKHLPCAAVMRVSRARRHWRTMEPPPATGSRMCCAPHAAASQRRPDEELHRHGAMQDGPTWVTCWRH